MSATICPQIEMHPIGRQRNTRIVSHVIIKEKNGASAMSILSPSLTLALPLRLDETGRWRVGETRIPIETVIKLLKEFDDDNRK
jgi:hypothetical protein